MAINKRPTLFQQKQARHKSRKLFNIAQKAESTYANQLKLVGYRVGKIIEQYAPDGVVGPDNIGPILHALEDFADRLEPWAASVSTRMQLQVGRYDRAAWIKLGQRMGLALGKEIRQTPQGETLIKYLADQVHLITSLPREAALRVHKLTLQGLAESTRAPAIAKEILRSGKVTQARAMLIARTEVARTSSAMTQARAGEIGSQGYIWRTSLDEQVRPSHRRMEGKFVRWDSPPSLIDGTVTHAGQIYNCRCWPEPVLADEPMRGRGRGKAYSQAELSFHPRLR